MSEEQKEKPEIQDAEILLGSDGKVIGITIPDDIPDDGSYHLEISKGNIDIIKDGEKISSIALRDDIPKEVYDGLAEQENTALISDNGKVMVTATMSVDKESTDTAPEVDLSINEENLDEENNIDYTTFKKMMEDNEDAEKLRQKTMEEFRSGQSFTPPQAANSNVIDDMKAKGAEEFIAQAQSASPLEPGDSVAGRVDSVASIGASKDETRTKSIAKTVGGFVVPIATTMAVKMVIGSAMTAALGPAIAAIAVPAVFAGYAAYKLMGKAKEQEGGLFKRLASAAKENKFHAGMLLGALAIGIAARTGGLEPIADFLDDKISAFMGDTPDISDTAVPLPDEYADLSAGQMKEKAFELFNGRGGEEVDQAMALRLYEQAAEMGSVDAKVDLAYIQYQGLAGVDQDQAAAVASMKEMGKTEWLGGQKIPELNSGVAHAHGGSTLSSTDGPRLVDNNIAALYEGWEEYPAFPEGSYTDEQFGQRLAEAVQSGSATAEGGIATIDPLSNQILYTHDMGNGQVVTHIVEMDEYKSAEFLQNADLGMMDGALGFDANEMSDGMSNMVDLVAANGGDPKVGVVIGFVNEQTGMDTSGSSIDVHAFKDADGNMQYKIITDDYFAQNSDAVKQAAGQTMDLKANGAQIVFSKDFENITDSMVDKAGINTTAPFNDSMPATEPETNNGYAEEAVVDDSPNIPQETEQEEMIREATEKYEYETDDDGQQYREDDFGDIVYKADIKPDQVVGVHSAEGGEDSIYDEGETVYTDPETGDTRNYNIPGDDNNWDNDDDLSGDDWIWNDDEPEKTTETTSKFAADSSDTGTKPTSNFTDTKGSKFNITPKGEQIMRDTVERTIKDFQAGKIKP